MTPRPASLASDEAHSDDAEVSVLGSMFLDPSAADRALEWLGAEDFYHPAHGLIFNAVRVLRENGAVPDALAVRERLRETGRLEDAGGPEHLAKIVATVPTAAYLQHFARIVLEDSIRRQFADEDRDLSDTLTEALGRLDRVAKMDASTGPRLRTVRASDVEPEAVEWLWGRRIPRGKLTLLVGDPSAGKSTITCAITAAVTRGRPLPGDTDHPSPSSVLMISAEDGVSDTIRPRLDAADADTRLVHVVECVEDQRATPVHLALHDSAHLRAIKMAAEEIKPALIVIDPLSAYLGSIDSYQDSKVRAVLAPLAAIAERLDLAIVGVIHMTKSSASRAIYRALGSIAFTAAARSVLLAGAEPDQPEARALIQIKSNLGVEAEPLGYRIVSTPIPSGEAGVIEWTGETDLTADRILAPADTSPQGGPLEEAVDFLRQEIGGARVKAAEILRVARQHGISDRTLDRAKKKLGVQTVREGFGRGGSWYWMLPVERRQVWRPLGSGDAADKGQAVDGRGVIEAVSPIGRPLPGLALYADAEGEI